MPRVIWLDPGPKKPPSKHRQRVRMYPCPYECKHAGFDSATDRDGHVQSRHKKELVEKFFERVKAVLRVLSAAAT